jgi:Molecular chaperone GrpE (heat shock protein)
MVHSSQTHGFKRAAEEEYLAGWQRARAEFDNFRKRVSRDQQAYSQQARAAAVASLLGVADNFQAIVKHVPPELKDHTWAQGVLHVARQFEQLLQENGVTPIHETGVAFDPAFHEAVEQVKQKESQSGLVIEIIQPGYKLGDNVLKPARVKVSA